MIFFVFLLQFFTVAVGLAVILLLAVALAGIWTGIRDEIQVRKIERKSRHGVDGRQDPSQTHIPGFPRGQ
jgi:hypothetical protein